MEFLGSSGITIREQTPRDYALLDAIVSLIKQGNMVHTSQAHITSVIDGSTALIFEGIKPTKQFNMGLTANLYK